MLARLKYRVGYKNGQGGEDMVKWLEIIRLRRAGDGEGILDEFLKSLAYSIDRLKDLIAAKSFADLLISPNRMEQMTYTRHLPHFLSMAHKIRKTGGRDY